MIFFLRTSPAIKQTDARGHQHDEHCRDHKPAVTPVSKAIVITFIPVFEGQTDPGNRASENLTGPVMTADSNRSDL